MKRNIIHNILGISLFFAIVSGYYETAFSENAGADSLEWMAIDSNVIVVGKIIDSHEFEVKQWGKHKEITIEISDIIKNETGNTNNLPFLNPGNSDRLTFIIPSSYDTFTDFLKQNKHDLLVFLRVGNHKDDGGAYNDRLVPRTIYSGIIDLDDLKSPDTPEGKESLRKILWGSYITAPLSAGSLDADDGCFKAEACAATIIPRAEVLTDRAEILKIARYWGNKFELRRKPAHYSGRYISRRIVFGAYPIDLCCGEIWNLLNAGSATYLYVPVIKELKNYAIEHQTRGSFADADLLKSVSQFDVDTFMKKEFPNYSLKRVSMSSLFENTADFVVRTYESSDSGGKNGVVIGIGIFDTPEQADDSQYRALVIYPVGCASLQPEIGDNICALGYPDRVGDMHFTYRNAKVYIGGSGMSKEEQLNFAKKLETAIKQQATFDGLESVAYQAELDWDGIRYIAKKPADGIENFKVEVPVKQKAEGYLLGDSIIVELHMKSRTIEVLSKYNGIVVSYRFTDLEWLKDRLKFNLFMATDRNYIFRTPVEIVFE